MKPTLIGVALSFLPFLAHAQWTNDPLQNLAISTSSGEQVLPKIAVTSDGGCWIGWFDSSTGSYAVRVKRLDALGNVAAPAFASPGLLVSNQPQSSSLVDWDLICDGEDHCVLTFTDTRAGSDLDVYAYRIDPLGVPVWGANGVTLSNNGDYEPNPRVCETTNGDFVFVWANTGTADLRVQRLDRSGTALYPPNGLVIPGDPGATPAFAALAASDSGSFLVSWVRTLSFIGNKHVHVQKFDAQGTPLWNGGTRLPVFDGGSVPIAHEPRLISDGRGGAVLSWHFAVGLAFSARVQRVLANGTEAFPHDGVDVGTNANGKFDPAIAHLPATDETFVCWNERNSNQSTWGIGAQKIDANGQRAWGASGVTLLPVNGTVKFAPVIVPLSDGFVCSVLEESLGNRNDKVLSIRVDGSGNASWNQPVEACGVASDKLRLAQAITSSGVTLLTWTDARNDAGDVFAQNVNPNGTLGDGFGAVSTYGCGVNPAGSLQAVGRPAVGATWTVWVDNPAGSQASGSSAYLILGAQPDPSFPCGTSLPGLGMLGGAGEVLIQLGPTAIVSSPVPWGGVGQPAAHPLPIPFDLALVTFSVYLQGLILDGTPGATVPLGLTEGLVATVGF